MDVVGRRGGVVEDDKEEDVLLRAIAGNSEIVRRGRIGDAGAPGFLRGEIDNARIERKKQIIASSVQRELLHGLLSNKAANVSRGSAYDESVPCHGAFCF